jgi:hypothetical protein
MDLISDKIHNLANVTITISSEKGETDKINGVGELVIEDPHAESSAADDDGTVTNATRLLREEAGDTSNVNSGEEEVSALLTKDQQK